MLIYNTGIYLDFWQEPTQCSKHLSTAVYRDKTQVPKHQVHVRTGREGRGPGTHRQCQAPSFGVTAPHTKGSAERHAVPQPCVQPCSSSLQALLAP